jgi:hypothetical protein
MDYVALMTFRPATTTAERDAALARRATYQYPGGVKLIAEYWPMAASPQVVAIFSANDSADVMTLVFEWNDVFDIAIHPALSAEDGLRIGSDVFAGLPRLAA